MIPRPFVYLGATLVLPLLLLAGCAASKAAPISLPSSLPLTTDEDEFDIRWALQEGPGVVQAVGRVTGFADAASAASVTLTLFGLDRNGRIVSRGFTFVEGPFGQGQTFAIKVKSKGRETKWEIRISGLVDAEERTK
jgi:hypothetical protein